MSMDPRERWQDPQEAQRAAMGGHQATVWTALPGIIVTFDKTKMTATVQPAIQGMVRGKDRKLTFENLPVLPDVPVVFPHAGGYTLTFPVKAGDEGLLVVSSRCIDAWWQSGGVQKPMESRMHDLSDCMLILGPMSQAKKIDNVSDTTVQLRSDDGTLFVEVDKPNGTVKLKSPTKIVLDSPLVELTGEMKAVGEITAKKDADNIKVTTHKHAGVQTGAGQTGEPVDGT